MAHSATRKGQGSRITAEATAPEGHFTVRENTGQPLDTKRLSIARAGRSATDAR